MSLGQTLLGAWLRISPSAWNRLPESERRDTADDEPIANRVHRRGVAQGDA